MEGSGSPDILYNLEVRIIMRATTITQTGVGTSDSFLVDYRQPNFKIGIGCSIDGTVLYTLEHTFDNVNWFANSDPALVGATAAADTNYAYPIRALRVVNSGAGTVSVTVLQGS